VLATPEGHRVEREATDGDLAAEVIGIRADLTDADIQAMFSVFCENFDGTTPEIFERDLQIIL